MYLLIVFSSFTLATFSLAARLRENQAVDGATTRFDDNGQPREIENLPSVPWTTECAALNLNCNGCPIDRRCLHTLHVSATPSSLIQPTLQSAGGGKHNAISDQKDFDVPVIMGKKFPPCPIQKCSEPGAPPCGAGTICQKDYCACEPGNKGQPFGSEGRQGLRGWRWPEALSVFVDPGVPCETLCDDPFCGEVRQGRECTALHDLDADSWEDPLSGAILAQKDTSLVAASFRSAPSETSQASTVLPRSTGTFGSYTDTERRH